MRKPREPHNIAFWLEVLKNPAEVEAFLQRGNSRQLKSIRQAERVLKWRKIQKRKSV